MRDGDGRNVCDFLPQPAQGNTERFPVLVGVEARIDKVHIERALDGERSITERVRQLHTRHIQRDRVELRAHLFNRED